MSRWSLAIACTLAVALSSCAGDAARPSPPASATKVPELKPGIPTGYLGRSLPDSLALVSPPPAPGSAGFAQDQTVHVAIE